jgi:hypothetical protein
MKRFKNHACHPDRSGGISGLKEEILRKQLLYCPSQNDILLVIPSKSRNLGFKKDLTKEGIQWMIIANIGICSLKKQMNIFRL